jgi:hypothetical protein
MESVTLGDLKKEFGKHGSAYITKVYKVGNRTVVPLGSYQDPRALESQKPVNPPSGD